MTQPDPLPPPRWAAVDEHPAPDDFVMWVIYNRLTLDHPGVYVLRRQWVRRGTAEQVIDPECWLADNIDPLRALLPDWLYCQPRQPGEDFTIVETWL